MEVPTDQAEWYLFTKDVYKSRGLTDIYLQWLVGEKLGMTRVAFTGVAQVNRGIRGNNPWLEVWIQSLVALSAFLLFSHLLQINSRGGQEPGVTHTHKDVHGRQGRQRQNIKHKTRTEITAFLDIIDIK